MKKLVKAYHETKDNLEKRPESYFGALFGMIVMGTSMFALVEFGGMFIEAPRPPDMASKLLGVGRLVLSVWGGIGLGMLIASLVTTLAWHALKRDSKFRTKWPEWTPEDVTDVPAHRD